MFAIIRLYRSLAVVAILCPLVAPPVFGQAPNSTTPSGVEYVSPNGSDADNGLSWQSAKGTIQAAYRALPLTGGTIRIPGGSIGFSGILRFSKPVTVRCDRGGVIRYSATVRSTMWFEAGGGVVGCTLQGQNSATSSAILHGNDETFEDNFVTGFAREPGNAALLVTGGSHILIAHNTMAGNYSGIFVGSAHSSDIRIIGNLVNHIVIHTSSAGASISDVEIIGNDIRAGGEGNNEFCEEVGAFGGNPPTDIASTGNICQLEAGGTDGGFSFSTATDVTETGDIFDADGHAYRIDAFELVLCARCTISGSVANTDGQGNGISVNRSNDCVITGNVLNGFLRNGVWVGVSSAAGHTAGGDTITGNTIIFSPGGRGRGIWQQCNAAGAVCKDNTYSGNTIISDGTPGSRGIVVENDAGATYGTVVRTNNYESPAIPVSGTADWGTASGSLSLSSGYGVYHFRATFGSVPVCTASDVTNKAAVRVKSTRTTVMIFGSGNDIVSWVCVPAAN